MKMKQTITLHAPSKQTLTLFTNYLAAAAQNFNDSGESPSGVWYEESEPERDAEMKTYIGYDGNGNEVGLIKARSHNEAEAKAQAAHGPMASVAYTEV
jgi:hypothetical protein